MRYKNRNIIPFADWFMLIKYINSWKRLVILLILLFCFFTLYLFYENRQQVVSWLTTMFSAPHLVVQKIPQQTRLLLQNTPANIAVVSQINLSANQQTIIYAADQQQRQTALLGITDLALRTDSEQTDHLINIMSHNSYCYPVMADSVIEKILIKRHVYYVCSAKIPPRADFFIGVISLGFTKQPEDEDYIKHSLMIVAENIIK